MTAKEITLKKYPFAYATYGYALFSNKPTWRIEDGDGNTVGKGANEYLAWHNAKYRIDNAQPPKTTI